MQAKRKLAFDEEVEEDCSDKRRKINEEEKEARISWEKWAKRYQPKGNKGRERSRIGSDSDVEVVDVTDSAPSTSAIAEGIDGLNVFPVKLENINVDDIVLQVKFSLWVIKLLFMNLATVVYL